MGIILWLVVHSALLVLAAANWYSPFDEFAPHVFRCPYLLPYPSQDLYWCGSLNDIEATCVHRKHMCDRYRDCDNGIDEEAEICKSVPCPEGFSLCADGMQCVPLVVFCDGKHGMPGCADRSDENPEVCKNTSCPEGMVKCADGIQCIKEQFVCDGASNCNDASDESHCEERDCGPELVKCADGGQCVDARKMCDGVPDQCTDQSDEDPELCKNTTCPHGMEKCADGLQCYAAKNRCNGHADCEDASDEQGCLFRSCGPEMVKCEDGVQCIWARALCEPDRWVDCQDGSDEDRYYCQRVTCPKGWKKCNDDTQCIKHENFCDGRVDCEDGYDERHCFSRKKRAVNRRSLAEVLQKQGRNRD